MQDPWNMTENMLADVLVSNVYNHFFQQNSILFKDKIVIDVGCRSGLLSYLAVEAGAVKVFAVGNMKSAKHVAQILADGEKAEIFEPLEGCISSIKLPCGLKKVDIIVSEWMGHALYADSLYSQVIFARDKWLTKLGLIIPNIANLYILGTSDYPELIKEQEVPILLAEDYVDRQTIVTEKFLLRNVNLSTAKQEDEAFAVDFKLKALRDGKISSCLLYFDVGAVNAKGQLQKLFSIGPETPDTYLKPTFLMLRKGSLSIVKDELLDGRFNMALSNFAPRGVVFSMAIWNPKDDICT